MLPFSLSPTRIHLLLYYWLQGVEIMSKLFTVVILTQSMGANDLSKKVTRDNLIIFQAACCVAVPFDVLVATFARKCKLINS